MATINATASTNNANQVLYSYSTKLVAHSDRASGSLALHGEIASLTSENLGVAVTLTDPHCHRCVSFSIYRIKGLSY